MNGGAPIAATARRRPHHGSALTVADRWIIYASGIMLALQNRMLETRDFLIGVELVSTRGAMEQEAAVRIRRYASDLVHCELVDWVSLTDNAGGNPTLGPMALGKPILYGGREVVNHLSCKDFNRHGLESEAWQLASEGFHNILALSGDYPTAGYGGCAKPVFDIDSVGLLTLLADMNRGMGGSNKLPTDAPHAAQEGRGTSEPARSTALLPTARHDSALASNCRSCSTVTDCSVVSCIRWPNKLLQEIQNLFSIQVPRKA